MKNDVLLSVKDLYCTFKSGERVVHALGGVSFDVMRGEIFGLVGESGSGKSTTGRIISGIYRPTGGSVIYDGEVIRAGDAMARKRVKAAKRRARGEIFRLAVRMALHPKEASFLEKSIDKVNKDLQNEIKSDLKAINLAASVRRKWGKCAHKSIRMVFQDPSASLNPRMTVEEAVGEALLALGVTDKEQIREEVAAVLKRVGLPPSAMPRYPHEFSGGQRQRVGIARAVITKPELLIADEPISALDASVGAQVINLLRSLARDMSLSVLFIAHDLSVVRHICDRVGVMYKGRLVELAPSEELFTNPLHPYTRALLSAIPPPDPRSARRLSKTVRVGVEYPCGGTMREVSEGHYLLCEDFSV